MGVRLVEETEEADRARLILKAVDMQPEREEVATPPRPQPPARDAVIEMMGILARILGFRIQLFAGFLGAVGVTGYALHEATALALTAAGMFNVMIFAPLCFLAFKRG